MNFARNADSFSSDSSQEKVRKPKQMPAIHKEGLLLKKSSKSRFGVSVWQKRYFVLNGSKLLIYNNANEFKSANPKEKTPPSKTIDLGQVTSVAFHYSRDAPVKSKKLFSAKNLEESRFDIYTPTRVFMLKSESNDIRESSRWVAVLRDAVDYSA
jgi:hypothetical protein